MKILELKTNPSNPTIIKDKKFKMRGIVLLIFAFIFTRGYAQQNIQIRNNASTLVSQIIDTAIFITIAFWGLVPNLLWMIISQYVVKAIIALLDTPFFYLLTRNNK